MFCAADRQVLTNPFKAGIAALAPRPADNVHITIAMCNERAASMKGRAFPGYWDNLKTEIRKWVSRRKSEFTSHQSRYSYRRDRKSTRLNSSHMSISYAVFCLKKKKKNPNLHILGIKHNGADQYT